jgi:tetratricopeptide (TPR) repeat protein
MKSPQIFAIIGSAILLVALYFGGNRVPPPKKMEAPNAQKGQASAVEKANFEDLKKEALAKLEPGKASELNALEQKKDIASYNELSSIWAKSKQGNLSAKYKAEAAKLENTEKSLTFASQYLIDLYSIEQNAPIKAWQASEAAVLLEKLLVLQPKNNDAKVSLAKCYTDGSGEVMKGVLLLREVATANPAHLQAGITLGRLAVQSAQFDKAIDRLEKLNQSHPKNSELLGFLADAYKGQGMKEKENGENEKAAADIAKAKELLQECKQIVNNPNFSKGIDEYIKTF